MPQIPPFTTPASEIVSRALEDEAQKKSRGGESSANPPSTDLPASVKLQSSQPPSPVPDLGDSKSLNPVKSPRTAQDERSVNPDSIHLTEKSINEAVGGKPHMPNVIATDGRQIITNDQPDDADHRA